MFYNRGRCNKAVGFTVLFIGVGMLFGALLTYGWANIILAMIFIGAGLCLIGR